MVESTPSLFASESSKTQPRSDSPLVYAVTWNMLHSNSLNQTMNEDAPALWKIWPFSDATGKKAGKESAKVPATVRQSMFFPYGAGLGFVNRLQCDWGMDGVDHVYGLGPVSTEQIMHPEKCWEWRDFPVKVALPDTLPGGWQYQYGHCVGEANTAVLFGCRLSDLKYGERIAKGWDGDRAVLYKSANGKTLFVWASAWDSAVAAKRFAKACTEERTSTRGAVVRTNTGSRVEWVCADGRQGMLLCNGTQVILAETDREKALPHKLFAGITFTQPPQDAERAAANNALLRFNPLLSWRKDGDYAVTRSLYGLLWRHDGTAIGNADEVLWGALGEWRRTASYSKWQLGWGWLATHEGDSRRRYTDTCLLPWVVLWTHTAIAQPQAPENPEKTIRRDSCLWGQIGSYTRNDKAAFFNLLPLNVLYKYSSVAVAFCV